ncbi:MAG: hypothetical protein IIC40_02550, partial [Candidatus Marinimicrobia bacterium]|nr:hypothetical protein [Candidatus Neomarinimicrobiota bacterium]
EKLIYFTGIDKVKFRKVVTPGDQIRMEIELTKVFKTTCKMKGKAYVDDKVVASAEMTAVIMDSNA